MIKGAHEFKIIKVRGGGGAGLRSMGMHFASLWESHAIAICFWILTLWGQHLYLILFQI